jgi:enoyl-[acyl-carrier protein] reductase III
MCVQKCADIMDEGKVVAVSSLGSGRVVPNYGAMGPTKAALESIVRYLAVELAPRGIRVNGVSSGLVETSGIKKMPGISRLMAEASARTPANRIGTPEDIADVIMFLVGPSARWICGQTILADGGYSLL